MFQAYGDGEISLEKRRVIRQKIGTTQRMEGVWGRGGQAV